MHLHPLLITPISHPIQRTVTH
ncbi:Protein of unknown function [Pyronema omphalodes CBS 100304]|uniref:Uncharacterized protein n=1 Tax=Pyronema omphalodes (strain CBS 100304) TaxID=1076935 RepID=U4L3E0_PYROM|nr:Protein of unknown function [Pyronema omphalodes CBS 100304]